MTDKEKIEKTYKKIQTKYPNIINKDEIDTLAIKLDKRNNLLISAGYILGSVVCAVIFFLLAENETFEETRFLFLVMTVSGIFECFRTLGKYSKIEQRYRPVLNVNREGILTKEKIIQDGAKILKKADCDFKIFKLPLHDKEDETDVGIENNTYHKYCLYFLLPKNGFKIAYTVKRDKYINAVIGSEYFVVITPDDKIATAYQATNWSVDDELQAFFEKTQTQVADNALTTDNTVYPQPANTVYRPNIIQINTEPEKVKKLLPILSLTLIVLSYFTPIIIGVPMAIAALVLAIVGLAKQRTKLSVVAIIVNVILFLLLAISIIAQVLGIV